jgi:hypothetical protein
MRDPSGREATTCALKFNEEENGLTFAACPAVTVGLRCKRSQSVQLDLACKQLPRLGLRTPTPHGTVTVIYNPFWKINVARLKVVLPISIRRKILY